MFTSHLRTQQGHKKLRDEEQEEENERPSSRQSAGLQRRRIEQQQQQLRQQYQERQSARVPPIRHQAYYARDEPLLGEYDDEPIQEEDWRQAAQMLTERDEMLLLSSSRFGPDATDVAPVNRRRLQQQMRRSQSPASSQQNRSPTPQSGSKKSPAGNKSASQLASRMLFTSGSSQRRVTPKRAEEEPTDFDLEPDDNSSISFAQSGCQSILSAWRLKAANRKRQREQLPRPTSVLSNASSVGKKSAASTAYTLASRLTAAGGKSPAAQTRIPLGPKSAQHFVTNSRRRRRANELILNTLEARRRAFSLNRQQNLLLGAAGSLFGSESYLLAGGAVDPSGQLRGATPELLTDYQRLSLSPSPLGARSPSPLVAAMSQRRPAGSGALSDLGARQSALVRKVQANKLQNTAEAKSPSQSSLNRAPPLAKLDQNSSDLCSSNDSSSGESSTSSSSSSGESRFTQLVTSELAPVERALMAGPTGSHSAARTRYLPAEPARSPSRRAAESPSKLSARIHNKTATPPPVEPPKPPARTRKKSQSEDLGASKAQARPQVRRAQDRQMVSSEDEEDDVAGSRLRRGALKRDSIRRLRMSRQSSSKTSPSSSRDEASDSPKSAKYQRQPMSLDPATPRKQMQPLSKSRKLDIESNPFLNRHHFRSLSQRSCESGRQSVQARRPATPNQSRSSQRSARATPSRGIDEEPEVRRVEKMLRQMKPGQVLEARSQERDLSQSDAMESRTIDSRGNWQPALRQDDLVIRSSPTKLSQQQERARKEVPKATTTSQQRDASGRQEFKTTTRLVREGARSSDDVKLDLVGNKRVSELTTERWRLEQLERAPERQADGSLAWGSSRLATSERVERLHSASISPPPGFSDRRQRATGDIGRENAAPIGKTLTSKRLISEPSEPAPPSRSSLTTATRPTFSPPPPTDTAGAGGRAIERQMRRAASEDRGEPARSAREWTSGANKTGATQAGGRQTSGRPASLANRRPLSSQFASESPLPRAKELRASAASSASGGAASSGRQETDRIGARMLQADLPKFERTADDEFRKRVDQLRQLARANLHSSELEDRAGPAAKSLGEPESTITQKNASSNPIGGAGSASSSRFLIEQKPPTLKPLSLNWAGPKDERPKEPLVVSRTANLRPLDMPRTRPTVASTDLDDMLLADRYQRPLPTGAWRRSNSSLASLSSGRPAQRPTSPFASRFGDLPKSSDSMLSQSVMSVGPREPSDAAELVPMRLVVKEKSAPKRDFAFVEQRPPVQRLEHRNTAQVALSRPTELKQRPLHTPQSQQQQERTVSTQRPSTASPSPAVTRQSSVQQTAASSQLASQPLPARSRLTGATSPQSPQFGAPANSSSNEDSAIASSVSSPSLSFSMHPSGLQPISERSHSLASSRPVSATTSTSHVQRTSAPPTQTTHSQLTGLRLAATPELKSQAQTSGALQSILRRQQQLRHQQELRTEVGGEQGEFQPATSRQTAGSCLVPLGSTSYTQITQTSLTKTTSTLTRHPIDGSGASVKVQPGELQQFGDNRSSLHVREASQEASIQQQEQQQQPFAASVPTNQKRVHFNDRTSVRSFESLSSEHSNSTAINNGDQARLTAEQQRQLIGSPDSMGSGSTSRLSCDSPDFRRVGSGGAIYAIRGDPELEHSPVNMLANQQQQQQLFAGARRPLVSGQQQAIRYQQTIPMQLPRPVHHPVAVSIAQQQFNQRQQQAHMEQQQLSPPSMGSPTGCIRMTAPPVINTAGTNYTSQAIVSPRAGQSMLTSPVMACPSQLPNTLIGQQQQLAPVGRPSYLDEEEDPNYAFRLRQAAANRAFNFIQQQQHAAPANLGQSGLAAPSGGGGGRGAQHRRPSDLMNFQTEV